MISILTDAGCINDLFNLRTALSLSLYLLLLVVITLIYSATYTGQSSYEM